MCSVGVLSVWIFHVVIWTVRENIVALLLLSVQVTEALKYVRRALQRRRDHLHSLHLLALLLSSQKQFDDAYKLIEATLTEYPDNFRCGNSSCRLKKHIIKGQRSRS